MLVALTSQVRSRVRPDHARERSFSWAFSNAIRYAGRAPRRAARHQPDGILVGWASRHVAGCKGEAAVQEQTVRPVKVAIVATAAQGRTLTYSGVVRPRIESALGFRVPGKIVARVVNVGDRVEVDQVIARLDETDLKLAENRARAAVAAARSRRDVANDNLERAKVLLPKAIISQAAYDTRRNELDAAAAALRERGGAAASGRQRGRLRDAQGRQGRHRHGGDRRAGPGRQRRSSGRHAWRKPGKRKSPWPYPSRMPGRLAIGQPAKITLWAGPRASASMVGYAKSPARPTRPRGPMPFASPWTRRRRPCGSA